MVIFGWILIAVVAWGALAFGAVYPWAYWPLATLKVHTEQAGFDASDA